MRKVRLFRPRIIVARGEGEADIIASGVNPTSLFRGAYTIFFLYLNEKFALHPDIGAKVPHSLLVLLYFLIASRQRMWDYGSLNNASGVLSAPTSASMVLDAQC
ncbi:hypothetical protein EVAR_103753_1 [Eumeta japonica]|uniref:Uncharacterized protein n=1 Tax=Eumeta variegata TaxID=151549 RepID=A0A4C2A5M9_EUMVA|nr:hypothetical protein EVAR_103753_1 [Eumeta japonica]